MKNAVAKITIIEADNADQNKTISLQNGQLQKNSNAQLTNGWAEVKELTLQGLATNISTCSSNQVFALGKPYLNGKSMKSVAVTTDNKLNLDPSMKAVARTKEYFKFAKDRPGFMLFDIDRRLDIAGLTREEVWEQLCDIDPNLIGVGYVAVASSSSLIYGRDGTEYSGIGGWHFYVMVNDSSLIPEYGKTFCVSAWLRGYGWILNSAVGSQLIRNLVDAAVFSPERLIFEAKPTLKNKLIQKKPDSYVQEGEVLELSALVVTEQDRLKYDQLVEEAKLENMNSATEITQQYIEKEAANMVAKNADLSIDQAKSQLKKSLESSELFEHQILILDDGSKISVRDVLDDPARYNRKTLHDPFEPEEGRNRAIIYDNRNGNVMIHSQLHGGRNYRLSTTTTEKEISDTEVFEANTKKFNENHASVVIGGKHKIARISKKDGCLIQEFFDISDLNKLYTDEVIAIPNKKIEANRFMAWFKYGQPRKYIDGVVFEPQPYGSPSTVQNTQYNLWTGFSVVPKKTNSNGLGLVMEHFESVICGGDENLAIYLIFWIAFTLQVPNKPAGTAVIVRGEKGTGKGIIGNFLKNIWGPHGFVTSNPNHLIGRFSGHLMGVCFLYADEAIYTGDEKGEATLKALITEPIIAVEPKGLKVMQMKNYLKIFMTTNSEYVVPATSDERRYFVVDASNHKKNDQAYFNALAAACNDPDVQADFLYEMLSLDLTGFDVNKIPETTALRDQRLRTLANEKRWLFDSLTNGSFERHGWQEKETTENLNASYGAWCERNRIYSNVRIGKAKLSEYLGKIGYTDIKIGKIRGRHFGKLDEAIAMFEKYEKVSIA